jgi:hypothetical protein
MAKSFAQFVERSYVKQIDEEIIEALAETVQEQALTEEQTDELIAELFGIGDTVKRVGGKIAQPFKVVHAGIAGAAARVKNKVVGAVNKVKAKSAAMDQAAAKKLQMQKMKQGKQKSAVYKATSGGMDRPTPVKKMTDADKTRLAARKSAGKPTTPVAKPKPIAARPTKNKKGVSEGKDPTTDFSQEALGFIRGEVKKNKDGSYIATNKAGSRKIFKSEKVAKAHANSD